MSTFHRYFFEHYAITEALDKPRNAGYSFDLASANSEIAPFTIGLQFAISTVDDQLESPSFTNWQFCPQIGFYFYSKKYCMKLAYSSCLTTSI
jgi:hypothetical protein